MSTGSQTDLIKFSKVSNRISTVISNNIKIVSKRVLHDFLIL